MSSPDGTAADWAQADADRANRHAASLEEQVKTLTNRVEYLEALVASEFIGQGGRITDLENVAEVMTTNMENIVEALRRLSERPS